MKKIDAIIRPTHWEEARAELQTLGVAVTLREVRTLGRTPTRREVYRGSAYVLDTATELELSMLVQDEMLESALAALERSSGDAAIVVTSVERVVCNRPIQAARSVLAPEAAIAARPIAMPLVARAARA
jgi:nitrogen regulatory protein PII